MRAVSISPHAGFGKTGSVADAVVDNEGTDMFGAVHPVVILNFGRYQSVISFEMFGID